MTLIMSYQKDGFTVMLGDLLVSSPTPAARPLDLPTRHPETPTENLHLRGLSQKIFLINPKIAVAWAGQYLVARSIIRSIASDFKEPYSGDALLEFIKGLALTDEEKSSVAFIFYLATDHQRDTYRLEYHVQDYLVKQHENPANPNEKFKFIGSGDFHFFETISFELAGTGIDDPRAVALAMVIARASIALYHEVMSEDVHNFFYGGGFEVMAPDGDSGSFLKIPLTICFWSLAPDFSIQLTGPVFVQEYDADGRLGIHRFILGENGSWDHQIYDVPNFMVESAGSFSTNGSPKTWWAVHYIIPTEAGKEVLFLQKFGVNPNLSVTVVDGSIKVEMDKASLLAELQAHS